MEMQMGSKKPFLKYVENPYSILETIRNKFKQVYRIENDMRGGSIICFTDDIDNPTIIFTVCSVRGKLSLYANDLVKLEEFLKQEDWSTGFLRQYGEAILKPKNDKHNKGYLIHSSEKVERVGFASVEPHVAELISKYISVQGFNVVFQEFGYFNSLTMDINEAMIDLLKKNLDGNECELNIEDSVIVNDNWKYKDSATLYYMEWSCSTGVSVGYKVNGKLVSWIVVSTDGSLTNLFTLPEYRGKQYARKVVSKLIINLYSKGINVPYVYIKDDNAASHALFKSLGFKIDDILVQWVDCHKQ